MIYTRIYGDRARIPYHPRFRHRILSFFNPSGVRVERRVSPRRWKLILPNRTKPTGIGLVVRAQDHSSVSYIKTAALLASTSGELARTSLLLTRSTYTENNSDGSMTFWHYQLILKNIITQIHMSVLCSNMQQE